MKLSLLSPHDYPQLASRTVIPEWKFKGWKLLFPCSDSGCFFDHQKCYWWRQCKAGYLWSLQGGRCSHRLGEGHSKHHWHHLYFMVWFQTGRENWCHRECSLPSSPTFAIRQPGSIFPNITSLLKILCTLPVTSCFAERSFSELKRSAMTTSRLSVLHSPWHCYRYPSMSLLGFIQEEWGWLSFWMIEMMKNFYLLTISSLNFIYL